MSNDQDYPEGKGFTSDRFRKQAIFLNAQVNYEFQAITIVFKLKIPIQTDETNNREAIRLLSLSLSETHTHSFLVGQLADQKSNQRESSPQPNIGVW